jgi:hypothetical protein
MEINHMNHFFLISLFVSSTSFATTQPPKIYVDKGACPFECCTYREWTVEKDTPIYSAIDGKKVIATAKAHKNVTAVTGEVHVTPTKIVVQEKHGSYNPGDVIYLLTYEGENNYKVWNKGQISSNGEVGDLFDNGSPKLGKSWGKPEGKPESTWWVKVKTPDGKEGWTKETGNFGNKDSCGG